MFLQCVARCILRHTCHCSPLCPFLFVQSETHLLCLSVSLPPLTFFDCLLQTFFFNPKCLSLPLCILKQKPSQNKTSCLNLSFVFFFLKCFDTTWKRCTLHTVLTSAHVHEACLKMQIEYSTDDFHSCRFYFLIGFHEIIYRPGHIFINN